MTPAKSITVQPISATSADDFSNKAVTLTKNVATLKIESQLSYEAAADRLKQVKELFKIVEEARKKITKPLDEAKAAVMALFNPVTTRLENSERHIKGLMSTYVNEQEKIRKAEQDKLDREAKEKQAKEKDRLERQAKKAEEKGDTTKAETIRERAQEVHIEAPTVAPKVQQAAGVSMRKDWKARVIDINKVPREYMIVNETALNNVASSTKGSLSIPGVEFYTVDVVASR